MIEESKSICRRTNIHGYQCFQGAQQIRLNVLASQSRSFYKMVNNQ